MTTKVDTEDPSSGLMHSFIKTAVIAMIMWKPWIGRIIAIMQLILDDSGNRDDRADYMETRLK